MTTSRLVSLIQLVLLAGGLPLFQACAEASESFSVGGFNYDGTRFSQWKLPKSLREISGLALDTRQRLFAHNDEQAIIYQLDYREGRRVKKFSLGDPAIRGDFEGIAVANDAFYLIDSDGALYAAPEGENNSTVSYRLTRTGLGERCEIEGLEYESAAESLLVLCKSPRQKALKGYVTVFRWSLETNALDDGKTIQLDRDALQDSMGSREFHPSGITVVPGSDHLLIVAAKEHALLELSADGELIAAIKLPTAKHHRQTEGIALTAEGDLLLADEGGGKRGRLGVYAAQ